MPTYETLIRNLEPFQQGNLASIEWEFDANFPLTEISEINMIIADAKSGEVKITKKLSDNTIEVDGQVMIVTLEPEDTKEISGNHIYECDFVNLDDKPFATIKGGFVITPEINPV